MTYIVSDRVLNSNQSLTYSMYSKLVYCIRFSSLLCWNIAMYLSQIRQISCMLYFRLIYMRTVKSGCLYVSCAKQLAK